jgi:hypothetical protein
MSMSFKKEDYGDGNSYVISDKIIWEITHFHLQ